jgi:UDP-GlcNAc:undecaprenyl-phosphate GlcNAc-1-phosphate transferase
MDYFLSFIIALAVAFLTTPLVKRFAVAIGAVDAPNHRKVHTRVMPRMGGIAIYLGYLVAFLLFSAHTPVSWGILIGGSLILLVGALDDKFQLRPAVKLAGQIAAALVVVELFGLKVSYVYLPFDDAPFVLGWLSVPVTVFWIVAVTNAVNLIDGLDGLAAGVSAVATATTAVMALMMGNVLVALLAVALLGGTLGFLYYNFHPAKLFMGDTGALFLGFNLAALSILGFKQITLVSFIIPILILGVPLSDTFFAIVRRILNKQPISAADKGHLHHCLMNMGFSHRKAVLVIYGISLLFGLSAVLFSQSTLWGEVAIIIALIIVLELGAEIIGMLGKRHRPLLSMMRLMKLRYLWVKRRGVRAK